MVKVDIKFNEEECNLACMEDNGMELGFETEIKLEVRKLCFKK
jgi:hypothetical protein